MNQKIQDVLDPKFENVEVIYAAVKRRQAGIIKALTMESDELFRQCDPETDNLCLYGLPDGGWKVALPAQDVPTELPEPALGINFARDGMSRQDWLTLIALHSDAWLLAIASFYGAELTRNERKRLLVMLGDSPTSYDIVTGKNVDDSLDYSRVHHIKAIDACSLPMITGGSKDEIRVKQVITDENDRGRMISNHTFLAPKAVTNPATPHKQWEQVLPAIPRSVENCRNQFAEPAKVVSEAPCVPEMAQSIHMNATAAVDDLSVPQADPEVPEASGSAPRERERPPARLRTKRQTKPRNTFALDFLDTVDFSSDDDDGDDRDGTVCEICRAGNVGDSVTHWVACDCCEKWFHCKCVKITPAKAQHLKLYKCPTCASKKAPFQLF
ncbi:PHD finger protein ALFIN-LIKE [Marchantia polymorpha subsp. ruderalis]|uniref:PHD-type domain-containing protein n=2 Tax=Marchantia polymorpha TaxID=3197 RepID=A0AAF6ATG7_MARPO|nr:hypothetical protein MARPO_0065s0031 [Marchantia polymorpha]BBM99737.1 hypothetical protein Mp_1g23460 [Marchantia polymorpha subsp. ruderalis]|eukprot:PTQ36218.1 hypothetical protein MARPO_0065s0031 [Marchantia polymorpha]